MRTASLASRPRISQLAPYSPPTPRPAHGLAKGQHVRALRDIAPTSELRGSGTTLPAGSVGLILDAGSRVALVRWTGAKTSRAHAVADLEHITCAACGNDADGTLGIHRDGLGGGPDVPLCHTCGDDVEPSCEYLWQRIKARRIAALTDNELELIAACDEDERLIVPESRPHAIAASLVADGYLMVTNAPDCDLYSTTPAGRDAIKARRVAAGEAVGS